MRYDILKIVNWKFKNFLIWLLSEWKFFYHTFAYYESLLTIGSYEITKRLQMRLNNPQCGNKKGAKFPIFGEITIKQVIPYIVWSLTWTWGTVPKCHNTLNTKQTKYGKNCAQTKQQQKNDINKGGVKKNDKTIEVFL